MLMTRVIKVLDLPFHKAFSEALNYLLVFDNSYRVVLNQIILCLTCSLAKICQSKQIHPIIQLTDSHLSRLMQASGKHVQ